MWHEVAVVAAHPSDQGQDPIGIDDLDSSLAHSLQPVLNAPEVAGIHVTKPTESHEVKRVKIIVTNLLDASASAILSQYAMRWGVEIFQPYYDSSEVLSLTAA